ncbi:MAG TPA: DHH family phosphoesterase [Nanoarchaeota archaeon]|nr:DHH family phosphoesterase [Nanoarchaeota archaeon]
MDIKNPERVQRLKEMLAGIGKESKLCLVYDIDADGMSSGALIKHAFEKLGLGFKLELTDITRKAVFSEENQQKIRDAQIDFIVSTDVAFPGFNLLGAYNSLLRQGVRFLVFDHHEYEPSMQGENSLLIHPVDIFGKEHSSACASKLVYDLLSRFVPLSEYEWLKAIGMIGDMNFLDYSGELKSIIGKYEGKEPQIRSNDDYFKTRLGRISDLVNSAKAIGNNESLSEMFRAYSGAATVEDLEKKLGKMDVTEINKQIDGYVAGFEVLSEKEGDIYFLEIKSGFYIGSPVSSIISQVKAGHTFIVYQRKGDFMIVNSRRQDRQYNMNDLMSLSVKGLRDSNGGGHLPAAGATIRVEDWGVFKQCLLENYAKVKVSA